jgi:hypothetical protein
MGHASAWPWNVWLAAVQLAALVFWKPLVRLRAWLLRSGETAAAREQSEATRLLARVADLEDLIDLLRKALDKHLIRESSVVTLAELLINMIEQMLDHIVDPPPALLRTYERALELLKLARAQLDKINVGGRA